jgi:hypothetical protein
VVKRTQAIIAGLLIGNQMNECKYGTNKTIKSGRPTAYHPEKFPIKE